MATHHDTDEDDETFTVALGTLPSPVTAGTPSSLQIRIIDDEGLPSVRLLISPTTVDEGSSVSVEACLQRGTGTVSAVPKGSVTVPVIVRPGTAEERDWGDNAPQRDGTGHFRRYYVSISGTHGRSCGVANFRTHRDLDHDNETLRVALDTANLPSGMLVGSPSSVWVTIRDLGDAPDAEPPRTSVGPGVARPYYAALIQQMREFRNDQRYWRNKAHTDRWDRALLAFGETVPDGSLTPMTAAEAQGYVDRGWKRWVQVAEALWHIEGGGVRGVGAVPGAGPGVPVVTISGGGAVTEGAAAVFTLRSSRAPDEDLLVPVTVSQSGAFAQRHALGRHSVWIAAGETSARFTVATVDDELDEPDGSVVVALGIARGYNLGAPARASVVVADNEEAMALPAIETEWTYAREGIDAAMVFTVRLSRASGAPVLVDYATADSSYRWTGTVPAAAGADYTAVSGTLSFAPGETRKTISVPIIDDSIDEGTEHFLLIFSNPRGATLPVRYREAGGMILNSDPLQAEWLSRFGRMVASDAVAALTARFETPRAAGSHLTVLGQRLDLAKAEDATALTDVLTGFAQTFGAPAADDDDPFARHGLSNSWNETAPTVAGARRVTGRELLLGTSFRAVLPAGAGSQFTSWGQGASVSQFSAALPGLGLTGEAATGSLGFDYEHGRLLTGFALTHSVGEGTARDAGWRYGLGSTATTVLPFARLALSERVSAWAMAGTGTGSTDARPRRPRVAALPHGPLDDAGGDGGAGRTGDAGGGGWPSRLALKADAFWVRTESDRVVSSEFGALMGATGRVEPGAGGPGRLAHVCALGRRDAQPLGGAWASP